MICSGEIRLRCAGWPVVLSSSRKRSPWVLRSTELSLISYRSTKWARSLDLPPTLMAQRTRPHRRDKRPRKVAPAELAARDAPLDDSTGVTGMTRRDTMSMTLPLRTLAARQWDDYKQRTPGTYFGEKQPVLSVDQAYAVQMDVARLRCEAGDAVAGYKVGCIGPGVVELFGMSGPIHARLFRSELRASGETLKYDSFANLAIEGEMAVRIGADGAIAAAFPVIELHHFVFRGTSKTLAELIANN